MNPPDERAIRKIVKEEIKLSTIRDKEDEI
jgi:hypothetical protein